MKDFFSGLIFLILGSVFKIYSNLYEIGTSSSMGPGYFPDIISNILIILSIVLIIKGLIKK
jgi:hypothetical protein